MSKLKDKPLAFGAIGGLLIGTVGSVIEKLWNDLVFPFPWPQDIWLETLAMTVPVAIGAGLCGALFALGLRGRLPAPNVGRVIVVGSILVTGAAAANGLYATVPKDATATFTTTQVGTDAQPEIMTTVSVQPADLIDDNPTWVQLTAWQGGTDDTKGVVTHQPEAHRREHLGVDPAGSRRRQLEDAAARPGRTHARRRADLHAGRRPARRRGGPGRAAVHPRRRARDRDPAA